MAQDAVVELFAVKKEVATAQSEDHLQIITK
jgi:hypothetical protein